MVLLIFLQLFFPLLPLFGNYETQCAKNDSKEKENILKHHQVGIIKLLKSLLPTALIPT